MGRNNIANLQRELQAYIMQGNDERVDAIQAMIDEEIKKQTRLNLNEIFVEETTSLNEIYPSITDSRVNE
jgi:hypothetical protein